ncbi:hypothetical protein HHX48_04095 [Salinimonas sp. HHU 13199]|uniref:2-oxo-4-hydroxy-4-carboxy-5-ureidoimidazoline decarboxylase n=1 Tax=Salinimonas profundi TaxID=2729140 RepID=A0ABR8LHC2_9ALTE|nr:2-oxo-4-hydroxy-4-carboxy-5-ureidoimidazoline decarboxylase [Salinimonas profundi]MBD3584918.1 hypothetical protein [Salinimonas profundi]
MTLDKLNTMSLAGAADWFSHICAARSWISCMVESRPYHSVQAVQEAAVTHWKSLSDSDYREALAAEPLLKISMITDDVSADKKLNFNTMNMEYLKKHGFIFITSTTDKSVDDVINELDERLNQSTDQELSTAHSCFGELIKKRMQIRLDR